MAQPSYPESSGTSGGIRGQVRSLPPWGKALLGCGVGCLGIGIIGVILFSIAAYYAVSPGEQIDTQRIVGPESQAIFRLEGERPDSQLGPFAVMVVTEVQKAGRRGQDLPGPLQWLAQTNDARQAKGIEDWTALQATITLEEGSSGEQPVAAINLPFYGRMVRWLFGAFGTGINHAGYEYYRSGEGESAAFAFAENTLLWAGDEQSLRVVLERLAWDQTLPPPAMFEDALARLQGQWDFYGVAQGPPGDPLDHPDLQSAQRWDLGLAAASEEALDGRLTVYFDDAQTAQLAEPLIAERLRARQDELRLEGLTSSYQVRRLGSQVEVDFSLLSLRVYVRQFFANLEDQDSPR